MPLRPHRTFLLLCALGSLTTPAASQIRVHPTGVNVNAQAGTTVFLTFGGLSGQSPAEAFWCGELISAAPDIGLKCDPATLFGRSPARFDRSRANRPGAFTDIMSIPPSVARRAWQAAASGAPATFFYVRRFVSTIGGPDEYSFVICRLTSGGARTPLALTDVTLEFHVETPVLYVPLGSPAPALHATIRYNGTGRLAGRWEIVRPGDELPEPRDLLPEASLPLEERGTQRRYTELVRFNVFLPPDGRVTLPGPPPERLPTAVAGTYLVLMRIEASDDKEGDSNLELAGAGTGVVHSGGVAGFPLPALRYVVATGGSELSSSRTDDEVPLLAPIDGDSIGGDRPLEFSWLDVPRAAVYRLEIETGDGRAVAGALVRAGIGFYRAPPWLAERESGTLRWRISALDPIGNVISRSAWRTLTVVRR
ncbi:MAG: hypothetical protein L0271_22320 [Gemmatimonadetes bacterium]|nr:hypothetical protein [Gemmatimonadota bacterium]